MKRLLVGLVAVTTVTAVAYAGVKKFTFNDVVYPDTTVGEIEASSKTGSKMYTTCRYFSDDYLQYLGRYDSDAFGSSDASAVENFCVSNYDNRN